MKRIALLCEVLHPPLDEGVRILAAELGKALSRRGKVSLFGEADAVIDGLAVEGVLRDRFFAGKSLARALGRVRPEAILYVPWTSLTPRTFLRVGMLRRRAPGAPIGVIALQPRGAGILAKMALPFGRPDHLFAIGPQVVRQAEGLGLRARRLEGGIDLERFKPLGSDSLTDLRRTLGLPASAYIVLHVGHLKPGRGVSSLRSIQAMDGVQALLITSTSTEADASLRREMQTAGVRVIDSHLPNVQDYYRASDCFLFPVVSSLDAIEVPLSVLEAMACNLPVVVTKFGGLPGLLGGISKGVAFVSGEEEIPRAVALFRSDRPRPDLRSRLAGLTWEAMARGIVEVFEKGSA